MNCYNIKTFMDAGDKSIFGIPARTLSLITLLSFIALGLIAIAFKDINKKPTAPTTINSIDVNSAQTVLTISKNPIVVSTPSGSYYNLDILIDTGANKVNSIQLELSYDSNVLQNMDILPGQIINNPNVLIKNVDSPDGRISFVLTPSSQDAFSGSGIVATLSFSLPKNQRIATSTAIGFLPKTGVYTSGASESVLKSSAGSNITLTPVISPTPTLHPLLNEGTSSAVQK